MFISSIFFFVFLKSIFSKVTDFITKSTDVNQVETHWMSESGIIDMFFMFGPTPLDVFRQYGLLTGTTNLPPVKLVFLFFFCRNFIISIFSSYFQSLITNADGTIMTIKMFEGKIEGFLEEL